MKKRLVEIHLYNLFSTKKKANVISRNPKATINFRNTIKLKNEVKRNEEIKR